MNHHILVTRKGARTYAVDVVRLDDRPGGASHKVIDSTKAPTWPKAAAAAAEAEYRLTDQGHTVEMSYRDITEA